MIDDNADRPDWYKDAVIYELHVRAFGDCDGDGIGDFDGLTAKLDYLQQLGVTALWLLPFYPSPLRDDGYDIADYGDVNPSYGDLRAFKRFLKEAHRRGLRVITELVLNHTSDQHPWFQRARRAKPGSRWRDFYVWSDTPDRYPGVRIIFEDYETSNWTWDPVAGAYYWHRFFSHQPDLNFDNPEVRATMLRAVDKWLEMGVDGVRLDAVPYLFEREGTNCENLPETHEFLQASCGRTSTSNFPGRMLLAEANQWPEDAVAYFGDGDECHMAFHFPLMPRLFMALRMEDRFPVIDILQQTPAIPETAQWAIFLRNHDELTLEMVTDEERDYMYRAYAADPQMRVNVGIRRRLAPLLQNDRRKIELMNALLFALPGHAGHLLRRRARAWATTSTWATATACARRCSGAPTATPASPTPTRSSSTCRSSSIPSTTTRRSTSRPRTSNPNSLLWWMRRLIALRQQHTGVRPGRDRVPVPRERQGARLRAPRRRRARCSWWPTCRASPRACTLDLHEFRGQVARRAVRRHRVRRRSTRARTSSPSGPTASTGSRSSPSSPSTARRCRGGERPPGAHASRATGARLMKGRGRSDARAGPARSSWPATAGTPARPAPCARSRRSTSCPVSTTRSRAQAFVMLTHVEYTDGEPETYVLPLAVTTAARGRPAPRRPPQLRRGLDRVRARPPTGCSSTTPSSTPRSWRAPSTRSAGAATSRRSSKRRAPHLHHPVVPQGPQRRQGRRARRAPPRGRAVEQLGRLRQPHRDEDVPPGPGGREPRPRDRRATSPRAGSPTRPRCSAPSSTAGAAHRAPHHRRASTATCPTRATPGTTRSTR